MIAARPAPTRGPPRDQYAWLDHENADCYRILCPEEAKLLGPTAISLLWEVCRRCGHDAHEERVRYKELAPKIGANARTMEAAMRRLRESGLLESRRVVQAELDEGGQPGYRTRLYARPLCSAYKLTGEPTLKVEKRAWEAWSKGRVGRGRPRKIRANAFEIGAEMTGDSRKKRGAISNTTSRSKRSVLLSPSEKEGASRPAPPPGWDQSSDPEETDLAALLPFGGPKAQPIPTDQRGPHPTVPAKDPIPQFAQGHPLIPENATDSTKVQVLIESFNASARERLGRDAGMAFGNSDPSRSKYYPALLAAAEALIEHDISPRGWADWRLDYAKQTGRRMGLTQVFQAATIVKLRGYFRRNHDEPFGIRLRPERWHTEQMFRAREAWARWEWGDSGRVDELPPMTCERWYYDMRVQERRAGQLDPLEEWPSKRGPRRAG